MIKTDSYIKALSLECLNICPSLIIKNDWNGKICAAIDDLDEEYKNSSKEDKIEILAKAYDLCLMMDVI